MNKERFSWLRRLAGQSLTLVLAAGLIHPAASLAAVNRSNGSGDTGGNGNEGDPLDSNDHSGAGGGGGGGEQHEDSAPSVRSGKVVSWLPILSSSQRIILIPEFQSGILVFRIIILETEFDGVEE